MSDGVNGNGKARRLSFPSIEPKDVSRESWLVSAKALIGLLLVLEDEGYTFDEVLDIVIGVFEKIETAIDQIEFKAMMSDLWDDPEWGPRRDI